MKRVTGKMDAVQQYFFIDLPKAAKENNTLKTMESNEKYKRICHKLKNPVLLIQLCFLEQSCSLEQAFNPFLTLFQKEEPLVHILHDQLSELVCTLMLRFLKPEPVGEKRGKQLLSVDLSKPENQLSDQNLVVGESTRSSALMKMTPEQQKGPIREMRKFYQTATKYLLGHLPLGREILKDLAVLHPLLQKAERGVPAMERTARKLLQVIREEEISLLTDEWKIYQAQEIPESWYKAPDSEKYVQIDLYWKKVLEMQNTIMGSPRFTVLPKLVKAVLCLAHGNAEVERSLSENKTAVRSERTSLSDASINAPRTTKAAVRVIGSGQAHAMQITPSLMQARKSAYAVYSVRMAEEREKKGKEKRLKEQMQKEAQEKQEAIKTLDQKKRTLEDIEKSVTEEQDKCKEEMCAVERLYGEVNRRLQDAIKNKNMNEITVVQGLLEVATKKMESARTNLDKCQKNKEEIDAKRRRAM